VQGELQASAEAGAVDRGNCRKGERANPAEQLVAGAAGLEGGFPCRHPRELVDIRARAEHERLARQHHRDPAARFELGGHLCGRCQRGAAENRRLRPVLAVVDRDERERAGRRVGALEVEDRVRHRGLIP
jgi:hypothetical protein